MQLLFVCPYTPTPIRTRPYNLLRQLARRGHHVTLATLWSDGEERAFLANLAAEGIEVLAAPLTRANAVWNVVRNLPRGTPFQSVYCWQPALMRMLEARLARERFDLVHVEHLRGAQYGVELKSRRERFTSPIVWDSVDCISFLFEQAARVSRSPFGRVVPRVELARTRRYEAQRVAQFDRTLVTSAQDRAAFVQLLKRDASAPNGVGARLTVLPNGVDLEYFSPREQARDAQTILFTGKMSYHANVTAALFLVQEIMPRVWEVLPQARVEIVGDHPTAKVRQLEKLYPQRVRVTGRVDDLRPYFARATVAAAPMVYGAGIQNKVLEAMAMATPVVATPTAAAALAVQHERELLIGADVSQFSEQVVRLLQDQPLRAEVARCARAYVASHHRWENIAEQLERVYNGTIDG